MASKLLLACFLLAGSGAAKDSCESPHCAASPQGDTVLLQVAKAHEQTVDSNRAAQGGKLPFFGLWLTSDRGHVNTVPLPVRRICHKKFGVRICHYVKAGIAPGFAAGEGSIQMLKWKGVREVVFESRGVKSHTRQYTIRTKSAGYFTVLTNFEDDAAPRGSGLQSNYHYKNTEYALEQPAKFTAGDPGYVFSGSFELQPGAKVKLTMQDGGKFDFRSFYVDEFEIA